MESFSLFFGGYGDVGLFILRLALGIIFLYHGFGKWPMWKKGAQMPMLGMMRLLAIVEPLAGLALIFGIFTQLSALVIGIIMLGALWFKISAWKTPFSAMDKMGWEFDLINLAGALAILALGAGNIALIN